MKKLSFFTFSLAFLIGCISQVASESRSNLAQQDSAANKKGENVSVEVKDLRVVSAEENARLNAIIQKEIEEKEKVPLEYGKFDFKNFAYQTSFRKRPIRIINGSVEYQDRYGGDTFRFEDISFVDFTGDGKEEAIVQLFRVSCGGSCDGGSSLFYIYSIRQNKLKLLWRIETGSIAYSCGLKSLVVKNRKITLETFRNCQLEGARLESETDPQEMTKFDAKKYSRLVFRFNGQTFVQEKREVFPYTEGSVKNYRPEININND